MVALLKLKENTLNFGRKDIISVFRKVEEAADPIKLHVISVIDRFHVTSSGTKIQN